MKNIKIITVLIILFSTISLSAKVTWETSYDNALKIARATNKPIIIDFWASWCGPCKKMDSDVWNDEGIQIELQNFVSLKLDIDYENKIASKYNVRGIPNIVIIDGWGNILYHSVGYKDKSKTSKLLKEFSINMSNIYPSLTILDKSQDNVYSNLRVAQKYQDVGFILNHNTQKSFLHISNEFFKKGLKLIKDDASLTEKVNLLLLLNKVYLGGEKSALKNLDKKFNSIDESNIALYNYVEFVCYKNLNDSEKSEIYYEKLKELNASVYIKKANYLINHS